MGATDFYHRSCLELEAQLAKLQECHAAVVLNGRHWQDEIAKLKEDTSLLEETQKQRDGWHKELHETKVDFDIVKEAMLLLKEDLRRATGRADYFADLHRQICDGKLEKHLAARCQALSRKLRGLRKYAKQCVQAVMNVRMPLVSGEVQDPKEHGMTDTELLDWLEKQEGAALVSDDAGHWTVSYDGIQNVPTDVPGDIDTTFWITKDMWEPTVREAIKAAMAEEDEE